MRQTYGSEKKAKQVFYSAANAGKLTGVHERLREAGRQLKKAKRRKG
jgi:hypothetical protein